MRHGAHRILSVSGHSLGRVAFHAVLFVRVCIVLFIDVTARQALKPRRVTLEIVGDCWSLSATSCARFEMILMWLSISLTGQVVMHSFYLTTA